MISPVAATPYAVASVACPTVPILAFGARVNVAVTPLAPVMVTLHSPSIPILPQLLHVPKVENAFGVCSNETAVLMEYVVEQLPDVQGMPGTPAGLLVIVPSPVPFSVTANEYVWIEAEQGTVVPW